jgi:hypothetical protein
MMLIRSVPADLLYICGELLTGKSIPVLVGIARLPIGQGLAWIMVTIGAVAGTLFSSYAAHKGGGLSLLSFGNRFVQLAFSLGLSVSLLLSLAGHIHPERGCSVVVIPVFCSVVQSLPQRHSTAFVSLALSAAVFYLCVLAGEAEQAPPVFRGRPARVAAASPGATLSIGEAIARAFQLFVLGFYACIQHAPTQVYFSRCGAGEEPAYATHHHARHAPYCLFVGLFSAWVRVCVWSGVCFMQDQLLHAMLENDPARADGWAWACCVAYMTALLYSACWTATQLREQVLPRFFIESEAGKLKVAVAVVALAALHRQRSPEVVFYATDALTLTSILVTLVS